MDCLAVILALFIPLSGMISAEVVCKTGAIDLVFVNDESGSIDPDDYKLEMKAAQKLTQSLDIGIGAQQSRVGMVLFDDQAELLFNLDTYSSNQQVFDAIGNAGYTGGQTNIAAGMDVAIKQIFQKKGRKDVPRIMILVTDGGDSSDVLAERSQAIESHIIIYALGVGQSVDMRELTDATGDINRVYNVSDYSKLEGVMDLICEEIAESVAPPLGTTATPPAHSPRTCGCDSEQDYVNIWLDIVFVVDSSDTVGADDFVNVKQLLDQIGQYYTIGVAQPGSPKNKFARVAIINTADEAVRFANFSTYKTGSDLSIDVSRNLKLIGGKFNPEKGIKVARNMFDEEIAARDRMNVRKVLVVFSSESIECKTENKETKEKKFAVKADNKDLCRLVTQMEEENIVIITVAMNLPGEKIYPPIDITGTCDRLNNTQDMVTDLMKRLCLANCYCLDPYTQFEQMVGCEKYGECVFVHNMALSYSGAQRTCAKEQETLTDVLSMDKNQFLKELHLNAGYLPYWIGGKANGNLIKWDSGIEGSPGDYSNWGTNQPDGINDCVYLKRYSGFKTAWYSDKCGMMTPTHFFSCQKNACSANNYCEFSVTNGRR